MTERMGLLSVNGGRARFTPRTLRAELRPAARRLAAVAVGFAGGWAVLYGALMPFGLGFVLGFAEDCFAPCAAGAALGVLLHSFGALSLRSCGTLVGVALCFALGGNGGAELVFYSTADALLAAAMGLCLRRFAPEQPGAGMLLVGAAAAAALGSVQLWKLWPGVAVCAALELYLCCKGQAKAALAACAVLGSMFVGRWRWCRRCQPGGWPRNRKKRLRLRLQTGPGSAPPPPGWNRWPRAFLRWPRRSTTSTTPCRTGRRISTG